MRYLITGGSGYTGTRFMEALAECEDTEEILDIDLRPPRTSSPKVRFVERSVTEDLRDLFTDSERPVDVAVHLAWNVDALRDAGVQRQICIGGTRRFLEGCAAGDVGHILFMSSATAYGAGPSHATPLAESEVPRDHHGFQYAADLSRGPHRRHRRCRGTRLALPSGSQHGWQAALRRQSDVSLDCDVRSRTSYRPTGISRGSF